MKSSLLAAGLLATSACQLLHDLETRRQVETARAEHSNCTERGYEYPGMAYVECRMDLHDQRLQEQWMELQLSMERQAATEPAGLPRRSTEPYRPLRLKDYRCTLREDSEGQPWIHCFEDNQGGK